MKRLLSSLFLLASAQASSQCNVTAYLNYGDCYNTCSGSGSATGMGAPPLSYSWSNGTTGYNVSGLCRDSTYIVTLTDNVGCVATDTITVPFDSIAFSNTVVNASCPTCCDGSDTVNVSFSSPPPCDQLSYYWSPGSGTPSYWPYVSGLCTGTYTVVVVTNCGCSYNAYIFVGSGTTTEVGNVQEEEYDAIVLMGDQLQIQTSAKIEEVVVTDVLGKTYRMPAKAIIDVAGLRKGIYIVAVITDRSRLAKKVIRTD